MRLEGNAVKSEIEKCEKRAASRPLFAALGLRPCCNHRDYGGIAMYVTECIYYIF